MLMLLIADVKPSSKASTKNQQQWHITYLQMVMPVTTSFSFTFFYMSLPILPDVEVKTFRITQPLAYTT